MYSYDYAKCKINECCHDRHHEYTYINYFKFKTDLEKLFDKSLFGQHLVNEHVPKIIYKHMLNDQSNSPLVISFNGWTGSGKSFVSALIAQAMFQKGFDSNFVLHLFPGHYLNMPIDKIMVRHCNTTS